MGILMATEQKRTEANGAQQNKTNQKGKPYNVIIRRPGERGCVSWSHWAYQELPN